MKREQPAKGRRADSNGSELERLRVLYNVSNILTTTQRPETVLRLVLKEAVKATRATSGSLILIDRATGVLNIEIAHNIPPDQVERTKLRVGQGVTGWVAKTGEPLLVGDARRSPHYVSIKTDVKSELAVPLIIGGEVVGVLNVDSNKLHAFADEDKDLLMAVAAQAARVMHAANLYEENRRKATRLSTLFKIAGTIVSEPALEDVLRRVTDEVRRLMDAVVSSIFLLDDKGLSFEIKAVSGNVSPAYASRGSFPVAGNIIAQAIKTRAPFYVRDVRKEKAYRLRAVARESGLCSLLAIPVVFLNRPIGVLNIYTPEPREFNEEDIALVTAFAGHAAAAIINAQRYQRIFRGEELLRETEKFSLLGALSAEIAHEVRNPLSILRMLTHSVRADENLSEESRTDLEVMETKLDHINKIVDQVLEFPRSQRNRDQKSPAQINPIMEDVCMLVGHKASSLGKKMVKRFTEGLPAVRVNPGEIGQAVLNLALNGLEAMRRQGETIHFSTGLLKTEKGKAVYIRIRDEGCGLPEEKLQEIFTPFFSMKDRGTGLGLFITRRIIIEHGGGLKVSSQLGRGTTFEIALPAEEPIAT